MEADTRLVFLHIPKCGTSLGITLIYYGCTDVPDTLEIRVAHAGIEPAVRSRCLCHVPAVTPLAVLANPKN